MSAPPFNLYDLTREQLRLQLVRWDLNPVHVARLWNYLYIELAASLDAMPELPPKLRARLATDTHLGVLPTALETASSDGFTHKYLLALADAERIETVLMRYTGRVTACLSSQVGCAMGCVFCATGQMGYTRHLSPGEIVAQAVHVARALRRGNGSWSCRWFLCLHGRDLFRSRPAMDVAQCSSVARRSQASPS